MDKPYFRCLFRPELESPVFVEGLPGFGNIGRIATRLLIDFSHAKLFTELYSPSFPDYVIVNSSGICRPPRFEFYTSSIGKNHFIILTGDTQPAEEDVVAHYELCDEVLNFVDGYGCKFIVTMDGVPSPRPAGEVHVSATSEKLAEELMGKGATIYGGGRIVGAAGLLLGLAKCRGWGGVCLLGTTAGFKADRGAAFSVFKFLLKMLGVEAGAGAGLWEKMKEKR